LVGTDGDKIKKQFIENKMEMGEKATSYNQTEIKIYLSINCFGFCVLTMPGSCLNLGVCIVICPNIKENHGKPPKCHG
jgi:hypothetical protein